MNNHFIKVAPGTRFERLTVIMYAGPDKYEKTIYVVICDCGIIKFVPRYNLDHGLTKSCGCLRSEFIRSISRTHGESNTTKEYRAWKSMKRRCSNPIDRDGPNYIKYGIKVCKRWANSYHNFLKDMGRAPSPQHSLDRYPNNKGHYKPSNCRWATNLQQARNHCD